MFLANGTIPISFCLFSWALATAFLAAGLNRLDLQKIKQIGLFLGIIFLASLPKVGFGDLDSHMIFAGLSGLMLGWASVPVLFAIALLHTPLLGLDSIATTGINALTLILPALFCHYVWLKGVRKGSNVRLFARGFVAGIGGVALHTILVASLVGLKDPVLSHYAVISSIPLMIIEGLVTGSTLVVLRSIYPDALKSHYFQQSSWYAS